MPVATHERVRDIFALIDDMQSGKLSWSRFDEIVAPGFAAYVPGERLDREQFKGVMQTFATAFSDSSHALTDVVCEGDAAMVREVWSGTQTGTFLGAAASGARVESVVFVLLKFEGDKLKEFHEVFDTLGLMKDTGVLNA